MTIKYAVGTYVWVACMRGWHTCVGGNFKPIWAAFVFVFPPFRFVGLPVQ